MAKPIHIVEAHVSPVSDCDYIYQGETQAHPVSQLRPSASSSPPNSHAPLPVLAAAPLSQSLSPLSELPVLAESAPLGGAPPRPLSELLAVAAAALQRRCAWIPTALLQVRCQQQIQAGRSPRRQIQADRSPRGRSKPPAPPWRQIQADRSPSGESKRLRPQ